MLVVLAFVCGFLVVLVVLVVFSRAPWGTPYHQILMVVVVLVVFVCFVGFWWFCLFVVGCSGARTTIFLLFPSGPRGSLGYPLSFPLTSIRFPQLLVLVVFGCGFWCFWWFWWFLVVLPWGTPYRQILLVARGCDGFVFVVCGFWWFCLLLGGPPWAPPPLLMIFL